ncbi:MAG TPA: hypothetical protein VJ140_07780 [Actinomycetota bacterium]|nr:hypothetical protein [Actinomycetota bacterium]
MPVDEIGVAEWSPGSVDQDVPPTQVHITFSVADLEFAIRLKTRERAEWLCATIMKHAENVWPKRT